LTILFPFIGGFGLFIFGMHIMAKALEQAAGSKLRRWLEKVTNKKYMGVLLGLAVTGVIQSSSATTVMVVGLVNAGIMKVGQTVGIIMGANIGTTVTAWLVSSAEWAVFLKPSTLAPVLVGIGAVLAMFATRIRLRRVGEIVIGFGILFMGMEIMSNSVEPLSESQVFRDIFISFGDNPFLGILAGAAVTAIIQSSSASVGILQSLAAVGLVPWGAAVYIIMGQNIGTCVTALLSSIGTSKAARSTAYIHLMFNIIGSIVFSIVAVVFFKLINTDMAKQLIGMTEIGMVHTAFNLACTTMLYWFTDYLVVFAMRLAGVKNEIEMNTLHLDDRMLKIPSTAFQACHEEISRMGEMACANLKSSCDAVMEGSTSASEKINKREDDIDLLQQGITRFLAKLCSTEISEEDNRAAAALFHTVNDIERVGDHSVNILEIAEEMVKDGTVFSEAAMTELNGMIKLSQECFLHSMEALHNNDKSLAAVVKREEARADELQNELRHNHMMRLSNDECSPMAGVSFLDIITNLERITDHAKNIAQMVERRK
jgi:phosphate:Na+ symporter